MTLKIGFAQATYNKDFEETKECINRVSLCVDVTIISYDQSLTDSQINWLLENREQYKLQLVCYKWTDDMPDMRNQYLAKAKVLGVDWLVVSDPDELFSENLASNLRNLIDKYDKEGYSILGVPVRDQFTAFGIDEWFDDLDKLKEYPAGYRETDYWKPMLVFKVFPDIHYEGIGIEKKVHETLTTQYKQKTINLPKEYFYVHKKNAIKIWRNAARNLFISGGGDNVGNKNRLWTELRQICGEAGINTWKDFEKFVENPNLIVNDNYKKDFGSWLKAALKAIPTKEGTETRETAKWYFSLHQEELNEEILNLIKTVPKISQESELENFVTQTYYQILGRHPDRKGLDIYVHKILNKEIKRYELPDIFKNSPEYREKFGASRFATLASPQDKYSAVGRASEDPDYKLKLSEEDRIKYDKIQKFVEQMYIKILGRVADKPGLNYYTRSIMEKYIKPSELPDVFKRSEEYQSHNIGIGGRVSRKTATSIISGGIGGIGSSNQVPSKRELKMMNLGDLNHNTVSLCIMGTKSELSMIKESINIMKDIVDDIHIQTDDFEEKDVDDLKSIFPRVKIHLEKWKDDFSDYKNKAYSHATTEWVFVADADEIPTKELAENLKSIIMESDKGINYDMVSFDVIDTTTVDGKIVSENRNKGGKALLFWNIPAIFYGDLHIWIRPNYYPFKEIHSDVAYKHVKDKDLVLERSVRNVVIGGGGDTVKDKNELWVELVEIRKELGLDSWKKTKEYLKSGNVDDRIIKNFQKQSLKEWKDEELKDLKKYYLKLHPNEASRFLEI